MGCGVTLPKHTFADDLVVLVGVPAVPLAAVGVDVIGGLRGLTNSRAW